MQDMTTNLKFSDIENNRDIYKKVLVNKSYGTKMTLGNISRTIKLLE